MSETGLNTEVVRQQQIKQELISLKKERNRSTTRAIRSKDLFWGGIPATYWPSEMTDSMVARRATYPGIASSREILLAVTFVLFVTKCRGFSGRSHLYVPQANTCK